MYVLITSSLKESWKFWKKNTQSTGLRHTRYGQMNFLIIWLVLSIPLLPINENFAIFTWKSVRFFGKEIMSMQGYVRLLAVPSLRARRKFRSTIFLANNCIFLQKLACSQIWWLILQMYTPLVAEISFMERSRLMLCQFCGTCEKRVLGLLWANSNSNSEGLILYLQTLICPTVPRGFNFFYQYMYFISGYDRIL